MFSFSFVCPHIQRDKEGFFVDDKNIFDAFVEVRHEITYLAFFSKKTSVSVKCYLFWFSSTVTGALFSSFFVSSLLSFLFFLLLHLFFPNSRENKKTQMMLPQKKSDIIGKFFFVWKAVEKS